MVDVLCHAKEKALKSPGMFHNQSPCSLIFDQPQTRKS